MTLRQVRLRVEDIERKARTDPEAAHVEEDRLYTDLLLWIARGKCEAPATYAREALKAGAIEFPRWLA